MAETFSYMLGALPVFLESLFTVEMLVCLAIGLFGGMIIGAMPGLTGMLGITLMLPLTYALSPIPAITMLMAIYTAAMTGGSLTAIMINTPGTPAAMATLIDGHPLARKGSGMKAMNTAIYASTFGSVFSGFMLLFISPLLAEVCLAFDAAEYFMISLLGIVIIAGLSEGKVAQGITIGFFGMLLSCIGSAPMSGSIRFSMDNIYLINGLNTTVVILGVFSVSQAMYLIEDIQNNTQVMKESFTITESGRLTKRDWKLIHPTLWRSSVIGVLCGIMPGAGANIGAFMAYNLGKRVTRDKENYGHGSIDGVAAPETANNAVTGGAMIPLITLGIPGSGNAALLLGGMLIHGLQPGMRLFREQANITYSIIFGFILASLLMIPVGKLIARGVNKISSIPNAILCPLVVIFSLLGAFSLSNQMMDVYIVVIFGIIGYAIRKAGYPLSGFVLGLLLGPTAEQGLVRASLFAKGDLLGYFVSRPICVVMALVLVLSILYNPIKGAIQKRKNKAAA